ncbi:hypothetical protein ACT3RU_06850 [Halomonas sp. TP35]
MATPANTSPLITVEKLVVNATKGILTTESAQQGVEDFNSSCQKTTMPFDELLNVMLITQGFGVTDLTATFQLDQKAPHLTWSLNAVKADSVKASTTVLFRGIEVELNRCTPATRQAITADIGAANPLADLEALEERTTAEAAGQLAATMQANGAAAVDIEDALCELRAHLDEHFLQRKLIRLYER